MPSSKVFAVVVLSLAWLHCAFAVDCVSELVGQPIWSAPLNGYTSSDFNVVTFGNFYSGRSGDVEGRVASLGNVTFGSGFSVGSAVHNVDPNATDYVRPWSLVVGLDLIWLSGALFPDGRTTASKEEGMYVAGSISQTPSYLTSRQTGGPCNGCLAASFQGAYNYYVNVSTKFSRAAANAMAIYSNDGIFLTSTDVNADRYYLKIDSETFNRATYWSTNNLNIAAEFIVTITGITDVVFSGGSFPSIPERTVFNIPGQRTIHVANRATGHILAPDAVLSQTGGDEVGMVIVNSIESFVEAEKPNCPIEYCCKYCPRNGASAAFLW